ncbi:MAG: enolase [bacterium]|nr:enolase [bacterium]
MAKIKNIKAKEIKDSRGNPTIEVELETNNGSFLASVPSGASTGKNEALELRDEDGKGVLRAIENINKIIAPKLTGKNPAEQKEIDELMINLDGTENKSKLGANAILAVSIAVCRAGAANQKITLYQHIANLANAGHSPKDTLGVSIFKIPLPMFNILEGGAHVSKRAKPLGILNAEGPDVGRAEGGRTTDYLDIQEFIIVPQKKTFIENLVVCNKVFQNLRSIIEKSFGKIELGDEGGFAPKISKTEQALYLLKSAIDNNVDVKIALDAAASQFYKEGKYKIDGEELTRQRFLEFYENLINNFPIISIEDPFFEEDWQGFEFIMRQMGQKILIVGDDLTTTNIKRIKEAHNKSACNGVILKLNQIGTVSETIDSSNLAKFFNWKTIVSHRSGETMDSFIADLSVGIGADFLKAGSPLKEERMVKYNRLLEIENELNPKH